MKIVNLLVLVMTALVLGGCGSNQPEENRTAIESLSAAQGDFSDNLALLERSVERLEMENKQITGNLYKVVETFGNLLALDADEVLLYSPALGVCDDIGSLTYLQGPDAASLHLSALAMWQVADHYAPELYFAPKPNKVGTHGIQDYLVEMVRDSFTDPDTIRRVYQNSKKLALAGVEHYHLEEYVKDVVAEHEDYARPNYAGLAEKELTILRTRLWAGDVLESIQISTLDDNFDEWDAMIRQRREAEKLCNEAGLNWRAFQWFERRRREAVAAGSDPEAVVAAWRYVMTDFRAEVEAMQAEASAGQ